jgi:hypothetical protein
VEALQFPLCVTLLASVDRGPLQRCVVVEVVEADLLFEAIRVQRGLYTFVTDQ